MKSGSREQHINRAVMEKYGGVCHLCGHQGSDQVDHVIPLAPAARLPEHRHLSPAWVDSFANRRPVHAEPCHAAKTAEERQRGRRRAAP